MNSTPRMRSQINRLLNEMAAKQLFEFGSGYVDFVWLRLPLCDVLAAFVYYLKNSVALQADNAPNRIRRYFRWFQPPIFRRAFFVSLLLCDCQFRLIDSQHNARPCQIALKNFQPLLC